MEIKKDERVKKFFKRYGVLSLAIVFCVAIALTITFSVAKKDLPVSTQEIKFGLPMNDASVVKDYSDQELQYNETLDRWEIHLSVDFVSTNSDVFAVQDGIVEKVVLSQDADDLNGCVVTISHGNGYVSVYSSMDDNLDVKKGDVVKKGQKIGNAGSTAGNEEIEGGHLHFTLYHDSEEVDPGFYLDLQNK